MNEKSKVVDMKKLFFLFLAVSLFWGANAQSDSVKVKTAPPTGWKFGGALPALSYNTDVGFRYGAIGYIFDWGDGSLYPDYLRSIYLEASNTTKGSGIFRINYDDKAFLGTNVRLLLDFGYYIEQALDFYGFNGYQAVFHPQWMTTDSPEYKSRMFYRMDRRTFRFMPDVQVPLMGKKLRLYGGIGYQRIMINSVNIDKLNKGKKPDEMLPSLDSVPGLFELYQQWGAIAPDEAHGGSMGMMKIGFIYDTRDNEPMPNKGLWEEAFFVSAVDFIHPKKYRYLQFVATHRQYFTILPKKLIFAYRGSISYILAGKAPFYMLPFYYNTKDNIQDGFGGAKTIRGIMRDRLIADGVAFGNMEMRWRVINTKFLGQDFYIALSAFMDGGMILKPHDYTVNFAVAPSSGYTEDMFFNNDPNVIGKLHLGYGGGIRFALNENFIVAVDYGKALNIQDGSSGLYIGLNWLF